MPFTAVAQTLRDDRDPLGGWALRLTVGTRSVGRREPAPACGSRSRQAGELPDYGAPERVDELRRRTSDEDTAARSAAWKQPPSGHAAAGAGRGGRPVAAERVDEQQRR